MTLAVLVCGWAHVLHAVYKPWASQPSMYRLQHASLGLTSFVFLMGLLFKVGTVCGFDQHRRCFKSGVVSSLLKLDMQGCVKCYCNTSV